MSAFNQRPKFTSDSKVAGKMLGKTALVTGGDSGIGRSVALFFAREGANIVIHYLPEEQKEADETCHSIEAEGRRCLMIPGYLTDAKFCKLLIERTLDEFGKLDILVSHASSQRHKALRNNSADENWKPSLPAQVSGW